MHILDRCLAVQAFTGKPLPKQVVRRQKRRVRLLVGKFAECVHALRGVRL